MKEPSFEDYLDFLEKLETAWRIVVLILGIIGFIAVSFLIIKTF